MSDVSQPTPAEPIEVSPDVEETTQPIEATAEDFVPSTDVLDGAGEGNVDFDNPDYKQEV